MALRASQIVIEALVASAAPRRVSQLVAEILVWNHLVTTPNLYPTLPGLGFSVMKRPKVFTGSAQSGSGWQVRIGYSSLPLWEWDLTYDLLSDESAQYPTNDLKTLLGFWLAQSGDLTPFLFSDPDDNYISGQIIAYGDGSTTTFVLTRNYGGSDGAISEPIGYLDISQPFVASVAGVVKTVGTDYTLLTTTPVQQEIKFTTAPASGAEIQVDMGYYYYVHFQTPTAEFEKFAQQLWSLKKVTLESLRG